MSRYWSDRQLDRITPPQVLDARGKAILRTLDKIIGDRPISDFYVRDAETCPAEMLPALIAEYSLEEFVEPSLPEHVQRRILKNAWLLQTLEGYDAGVILGLGLLGMTAVIEQWWQANPKRAANSHTIYFRSGEQLYAEGQQFYRQREIHAAQRMIEATKRWSQDTTLAFVEDFETGVSVRTGLRQSAADKASYTAAVPVFSFAASASVATGFRDRAVDRIAITPEIRSAA